MISNFGPSDGGRESWAYNFVPRLLAAEPDLKLHVFGARRPGEPDTSAIFRCKVAPADRDRLVLHFAALEPSRLPASLNALFAIRRMIGSLQLPRFEYSLAVGSFLELAIVLFSPALARRPKVAWLRTVWIEEKARQIPKAARRFLRGLERRVLGRADLIIANGDDTAEHYRAEGLTAHVIRNAVDFDRWFRAPALPPAGRLRVGYIGRLSAVKGIGEFVALARSWTGGQVEFHVIGAGPEEAGVRKAERDGHLVYHGPVPNDSLPALLAELDATVALTFKSSEGGTGGVSNALLEQMAAGKVILAWDNAIFRQLLDRSSAYLVDEGSVEALDDAVRTILENPVDAQGRARSGQEVARAHSFERHMGQFEQLIGSLRTREPRR
jgi:glycosyltransferase involved in cell wall biosynthesis